MRPLYLLPLLAACAAPVENAPGSADLPLGDVADELKDDGTGWGAALTCKPIPSLPQLVNPRITVSIQGLTLHLVDDAGFDKVFPIGPGEIETDEGQADYGESKTYAPLLGGQQDYTITPAGETACKTWWTDPDTGAKSPVFAGLPFLSWNGAYGIHGPIDGFRAANGGALRRGFVSHGCVRMEAADIAEVYARIKGVASVPVHVQREPERLADGTRVDVDPRWIGSECSADEDCDFAGGYCAHNAWSDRGFCSVRCTRSCADKAGYPTTFCVADPDDSTQGMCVPKAVKQDYQCRPFDHFVARTATRFHGTTSATVCVPGSPGWVGDRCLADGDCQNGTSCQGGICAEACTRYCADEPGWASTFCAADGLCERQCTPSSNASECAADTTCVATTRHGDASTTRYVCEPTAG
jgi:hypothetical protein